MRPSPRIRRSQAAVGTRTYTGTQLSTAGRVRYEYDAAGRTTQRQITRLSKKPATWHYTWDVEDRLTLPGPYTMSWDHRGLHPLAQTETITTPATADTPQDQIDRRFFAIVTDLVGTPTELVDTATNTIAWRATPTLRGHTTWAADRRPATRRP
ncbi:hypothetical protein [Streptomyces halobius]|uniref:hypothetical protein n=1 Tax=Streptomyces halobius TaxID=2879846 RepID=UPI003873AADD